MLLLRLRYFSTRSLSGGSLIIARCDGNHHRQAVAHRALSSITKINDSVIARSTNQERKIGEGVETILPDLPTSKLALASVPFFTGNEPNKFGRFYYFYSSLSLPLFGCLALQSSYLEKVGFFRFTILVVGAVTISTGINDGEYSSNLYCKDIVHCEPTPSPMSLPSKKDQIRRSRRPPIFGTSIIVRRELSSQATRKTNDNGGDEDKNDGDGDENEDDCPICRKYSKGPCGRFFLAWLECVDAYSGKDKDKKKVDASLVLSATDDRYISECTQYAEPLAKCLEENKEYYSNSSSILFTTDRKEEDRGNTNLRDAWEQFVDENAAITKTRIPFPDSLKPDINVRPKDRVGIANFPLRIDNGSELLMAFVQKHDKNDAVSDDNKEITTLLAAGGREDLAINEENQQFYGMIRFQVPSSSSNNKKNVSYLSACALYENEREESTILYHYKVEIPSEF